MREMTRIEKISKIYGIVSRNGKYLYRWDNEKSCYTDEIIGADLTIEDVNENKIIEIVAVGGLVKCYQDGYLFHLNTQIPISYVNFILEGLCGILKLNEFERINMNNGQVFTLPENVEVNNIYDEEAE